MTKTVYQLIITNQSDETDQEIANKMIRAVMSEKVSIEIGPFPVEPRTAAGSLD